MKNVYNVLKCNVIKRSLIIKKNYILKIHKYCKHQYYQ